MCVYIYTALYIYTIIHSIVNQLYLNLKKIHSLNAETANLWGKSDEFALNFLSESFFFLKSCFSNGTNQRGSMTHRTMEHRLSGHWITLFIFVLFLSAQRCPLSGSPRTVCSQSTQRVQRDDSHESVSRFGAGAVPPHRWCSGNVCWLNAPSKLVSQDKEALFPHHVETQQKLNGSFF